MALSPGGALALHRVTKLTGRLFPPALLRLLYYQAAARWRRIGQGFATPRRWVLSTLALLVGAVWVGNAMLAVLLREGADPQKLERLISLGLLGYAVWHLLKAAYRRPEEPVEWTPAEHAWVCAGPFERRHLLAYRFGAVLLAAALKAALFVLLLLPDLRSPGIAYAGVLLALLFVELWRMAWDIAAWGAGRGVYAAFRIVVLMGAAALFATIALDAVVGQAGWRTALASGELSWLGAWAIIWRAVPTRRWEACWSRRSPSSPR